MKCKIYLVIGELQRSWNDFCTQLKPTKIPVTTHKKRKRKKTNIKMNPLSLWKTIHCFFCFFFVSKNTLFSLSLSRSLTFRANSGSSILGRCCSYRVYRSTNGIESAECGFLWLPQLTESLSYILFILIYLLLVLEIWCCSSSCHPRASLSLEFLFYYCILYTTYVIASSI